MRPIMRTEIGPGMASLGGPSCVGKPVNFAPVALIAVLSPPHLPYVRTTTGLGMGSQLERVSSNDGPQ